MYSNLLSCPQRLWLEYCWRKQKHFTLGVWHENFLSWFARKRAHPSHGYTRTVEKLIEFLTAQKGVFFCEKRSTYNMILENLFEMGKINFRNSPKKIIYIIRKRSFYQPSGTLLLFAGINATHSCVCVLSVDLFMPLPHTAWATFTIYK